MDAVKRKEIYQELMKQLDKEENDFMPQVTVDEHYLNFGRVHFYERVQRSFKITNTGPVTVRFLFKEQPKGRRYAKDWLKADPHNGTLKKGESVSISGEHSVSSPNMTHVSPSKCNLEWRKYWRIRSNQI